MRALFAFGLVIFTFFLDAATGTNYEFAIGQWFDGQIFQPKKMYAVNGILKAEKPQRIDKVIDLKNGYVIPPFGEAHNHNIADSSRIDAILSAYLAAGIFYVKNPNSLPRATTPLKGKINTHYAIDAVFSNGGLTGSGGHPLDLVERNIQRGIWKPEDQEGAFYYIIDSTTDLDRKWDSILAGRPDFIKTYLLYSEEYKKRKEDDSFRGWRGLDPTVLPEIVRRAHEAELRVSTHVETATDFHNALIAGVDEINHLPGFRPEKNDPASYANLSRYEITDADAQLAAKRKVFVVTTIGDLLTVLKKVEEPQRTKAAEVRELLRRNLRKLHENHVAIAIGSDQYMGTALSEAMSLHELGVFDNLTLLKMWCEVTAQTIFPKRKIGILQEDYEANFLVLTGDPIKDFTNVQKIALRVKHGEVMTMSARRVSSYS